MLVGKLPAALLQQLLGTVEIRDPAVVVGPRVGEDAAVLDLGHTYLVAKSDPITFTAHRIGWYALQVNANDVACMGARPRWFLATLLLPSSSTEESVSRIFADLLEACRALGVTLVGGHTEVTEGLDRPILCGTLLGEVAKDRLVVNANGQPGDVVLLTKGIAIEGTSILAHDAADALKARGIDQAVLARAQEYLTDPGISVVPEATALCAAVHPHALHDPTEGGLATALWELATAAGCGLEVDLNAVPVLPETRAICAALDLDPFGLLASGALLAAVAPGESEPAVQALTKQGISTHVIGRLTEAPAGLRARRNGTWQPLPQFRRDELARYFEGS